MLSAEIVLAAVLLTSPPSGPKEVQAVQEANGEWRAVAKPATKDERVLSAWVNVLRPSLAVLAVDGEVIDPRETWFASGVYPLDDLAAIQGRYQQLAGAPMLGEAYWLPEQPWADFVLAVNQNYRTHLESRLKTDLYLEEELREAIAETRALCRVWAAVNDAQRGSYYVGVRRESLCTLRDLIGARAFNGRELPPHLPVRHLLR